MDEPFWTVQTVGRNRKGRSISAVRRTISAIKAKKEDHKRGKTGFLQDPLGFYRNPKGMGLEAPPFRIFRKEMILITTGKVARKGQCPTEGVPPPW
ncbi:MAG: hypothetical protein ACYDB0_01065 [Acidithiobacillus sp.]